MRLTQHRQLLSFELRLLRFEDLVEVVDLIEEIEFNDSLYEKYVTAPVFPEGKIPDLLRPESVLTFFEENILC